MPTLERLTRRHGRMLACSGSPSHQALALAGGVCAGLRFDAGSSGTLFSSDLKVVLQFAVQLDTDKRRRSFEAGSQASA